MPIGSSRVSRFSQVGDGIPDSVVLQYFGDTWVVGDSVWVDDNNNEDMSLTGDLTDDTLSDGKKSLRSDGANDYGQLTLPSSFEGSGLNSFSIEYTIEYTNNQSAKYFWSNKHTSNNQFIGHRSDQDANFNTDAGNFMFQLYDRSDNRIIVSPNTNPNLNDGNRHDISVIVNDASVSDVSIILDGSEVGLTVNRSDNPTDFGSWDQDLHVWARIRSDSTITGYKEGEIGAIRFHDTNISEQTINDYR